jgi:hypothetical protein
MCNGPLPAFSLKNRITAAAGGAFYAVSGGAGAVAHEKRMNFCQKQKNVSIVFVFFVKTCTLAVLTDFPE